MLYPENFEEKIDFVSIRERLKALCISSLGKERVDNIAFSADFEQIEISLNQTDEMFRLLHTENETLPIGNFYDLRQAFARVRVEGLYFDETEIFDLRRTLETVNQLLTFIQKREENAYPYLRELTNDVGNFTLIIKQIDTILNKFGKIKDNASLELLRIRKEIFSAQSSVSRILNNILRQAQVEGYVEKDLAPTMREGRLVIPVSPAFKRKISGIIHDESATGKTVFIEPAAVVEANNRIRELESEERREIIHILTEFTTSVRPYTAEIIHSQHFLGAIDFLRAKAIFAFEINAIRPKVENFCQVEWTKATHPLLYLSLKKQNREIVPLDVEMNENQRILLISGPNAGGKSICLKTVALLQYMLQCGLLVSLHENSRCGIFERLFIDIGDEQSIENDLSTYSSHLTNMKFFIKNSNAKTLLLIDEFGTGTEPMIGGALAEATLERFNANRAFGVITTHYTNLKHFAQDAVGVVNAAMLYDRQHFEPLFRLSIGNAGSSFAVEIARKIGLPEDIIAAAAEKVGAEHLDYDKHLQDIVRDKRYWERKRQEIRQKEKHLEDILAKYENKISDLEQQKKDILKQSKLEAADILSQANAKIENTIRAIKEANAEKATTREIRKSFEDFKNRITNVEAEHLPPKTQKKQKNNVSTLSGKPFIIGDKVRLKNQENIGQIIEIQDKNAVVAFGNIKTTVKISFLEQVTNNAARKISKSKYENIGKSVFDDVRERKLHFKTDIDLRGMHVEEALQAVLYFIDDAIMVGVSSVRILHGTGTGALKQNIRQLLNTIPQVKSAKDEMLQLGGAGITVVEFF